MPLIRLVYILIAIFGLSTSNVFGQEIKAIKLEGLKRTKESFVLRQIESKTYFNDSIAKADLNRLRSLFLFSSIDYKINEESELVFRFDEVQTILPGFNIGGISESHNFFINLALFDYNSLGIGNLFNINYTYFDRHSLELYYKIRRFRNKPFGASFFGSRRATIEPLYFEDNIQGFFNFTQWRAEAFFFLNRSIDEDLGVGIGAFNEKYQLNFERTDPTVVDLIPQDVISDKLSLKFIYNLRKINYLGHQLDGWRYNFGADFIFNINERVFSDALFAKIYGQITYYKRFKNKWGWANRLRLGISSNNGSPFASFVKDNYINARGTGDRSARGYAEISFNSELRNTLFWNRVFFIEGIVFFDMVTLAPSGDTFKSVVYSENLDGFFGVGLRIGLNQFYKTIFRLDTSFTSDLNNFEGVIFGIGQFF